MACKGVVDSGAASGIKAHTMSRLGDYLAIVLQKRDIVADIEQALVIGAQGPKSLVAPLTPPAAAPRR
jgi:hypothetical protein